MKRLLPCTFLAAATLSCPAQEPLKTQLERARKAEDKSAQIELQRRMVAAGQTDAGLLRDLIAGMIEAGDATRAAAVLDGTGKKLGPAVEEELRGDIALGQGKESDAMAAWERALAARPGARTAAVADKLAEAAKRTGKPEAAIRTLRKVVPGLSGADGGRIRMQLALALLRNGDFEDAVKEGTAASKAAAAETFVKSSFPSIEALQRGLATLTAGLTKAKANPDAFTGQMEVGALCAAAGALPAAQRAADAALKAQPGAVAPTMLKGYALRSFGQPEEAAKLRVAPIPDGPRFVSRLLPALMSADVALRNGPEAGALARRAANLLAAGQPLLALEAAEAALQADPKNGIGALIAGQASSQLGRRADAVRFAKMATELAPRDAEAWNFSAQLQRRRTDFRGAVEAFSQALALAPRDVDSLKGREACLRTLGRDGEADRDREAWVTLTAPKPTPPPAKSTPAPTKRG